MRASTSFVKIALVITTKIVIDKEIEISQMSVKNSQKQILRSPIGESNF